MAVVECSPCILSHEEEPMIYEVRTYTLRPGAVAEFEERLPSGCPCGRNTLN